MCSKYVAWGVDAWLSTPVLLDPAKALVEKILRSAKSSLNHNDRKSRDWKTEIVFRAVVVGAASYSSRRGNSIRSRYHRRHGGNRAPMGCPLDEFFSLKAVVDLVETGTTMKAAGTTQLVCLYSGMPDEHRL